MLHAFRDDARRRTIVTLSGTVRFGEFARFLSAQRSQDVWDYGALYDAREATIEANPGDLEAIASHVDVLNQPRSRGPVAVVGTDARTLATIEALVALVRPLGIEVALFSDMESAERWLDERLAR
jgi:hypothetical protein